MPIYEYVCTACGKKSSVFFRTITASTEDPDCPRCGERALKRTMSRFWSPRSKANESEHVAGHPTFEHDGVPFYGGHPSMLDDDYTDGDSGMTGDDSDYDAAEFAKEARAMSAMMGEPLDSEFDAALRYIEQGADPDEVFGELDERAPESIEDDNT